jgi:hypothetical protein
VYSWIDRTKSGAYRRLIGALDDVYDPSTVVARLKTALSPDVTGILVETNYVDKDYRSTYYSFYAKKGLRYSASCVRLHFFKDGVRLVDDVNLVADKGKLDDFYVGYMVLRPTPSAPIGRTVLSVHARDGVRGGVIQAEHHVHLLGERLTVSGFPYMQQHSDISVCAHAACWAILRHYTQKHRCYAEFLVTDITKMAAQTDPGGLVPSRGINLEQVARIFSLARLYPDTYMKEELDPGTSPNSSDGNRFYRHLNAYVESGMPVFAAMHAKQHAITVMGQGNVERNAFKGNNDPVLFEWDAIHSLIVVDDNHMPYLSIDSLDGDPYSVADIDAFVIPLPEKIYYPAEAVELQILHLLEQGYVTEPKGQALSWAYLKQPVVRYFLTTASRIRTFARDNKSAYPRDLFKAIMELTLPQFLWVAQIASHADWTLRRSNVMFLIDATASALDEDPFFLVHDRDRAFVHDRGDSGQRGWLTFPEPFETVSEFREILTYRPRGRP